MCVYITLSHTLNTFPTSGMAQLHRITTWTGYSLIVFDCSKWIVVVDHVATITVISCGIVFIINEQ